MFKNNPVASVLVSVLFILGLLTCWMSVRYFFSAREIYSIQARYQSLQGTLTAVQSLANDTLAYSQRDPAIDPLLRELGMKPRPAAAAPAQGTAPKPARTP